MELTVLFGPLLMVYLSLQTGLCLDVNQLAAKLADEVAERYITDERTCITIVSDIKASELLNRFLKTVVRIHHNSSQNGCNQELRRMLQPSFKFMCTWYIVQMSSPRCFILEWFEARRVMVYERHTPKIFVLPLNTGGTTEQEEFLSMNETNISPYILVAEHSALNLVGPDTIAMCVTAFKKHVNKRKTGRYKFSDSIFKSAAIALMFGDREWPILMHTNNFYQLPHEPGRISKVFLDRWNPNRGFQSNVNLFPEKIDDLQQKTIRLFPVPYIPYSNDDPLDGAEVRIVKEYCKVHNCSVEGVYDGESWGNIFPENRTGFGEVGALYKGLADIGVGANTFWLEFWPHLDFSACYLGGATVIICPKPELLGGWMTPFFPFTVDVWMIVSLTVVSSALALYTITKTIIKISLPEVAERHKQNAKFATITDAVIRSIGMLVLQQPSKLVSGSPIRHLFTSLEIFYLVVTTCYVAELYDYLTIPTTTKPIDTIEDIVENQLTWMGYDDVWIYGLIHTDDPLLQSFVKLFKAYPAKKIQELAETGGYGIAVERMSGGHYVQLPYITEKFISLSRVMTGPDIYGMTPITLFLQKGSPYTESLNRFIGYMQNGGLYYAWEFDCARKYLNYTIQESLTMSTKKPVYPPKVLSLSNLEGAFLIHIIGILVATVVFIIEIRVN